MALWTIVVVGHSERFAGFYSSEKRTPELYNASLIPAIFLVCFAGAAHATETMVCENPRREYLVSFDGEAVHLGDGPTIHGKVTYKKGKPVIDVTANGDAPRRKIDFSRHEIKIYYDDSDNDADQIDTCMSKKDYDAVNNDTDNNANTENVMAEIKASCTAQWRGKPNQYSMIAYCIEREVEALAKIGKY